MDFLHYNIKCIPGTIQLNVNYIFINQRYTIALQGIKLYLNKMTINLNKCAFIA